MNVIKYKYTYVDNNHCAWVYPVLNEKHGHWQSPVIFECIATSLSEADALLIQALNDGTVKLVPKGKPSKPCTSFDVSKLPNVACSFSKVKTFWEKVLDILMEFL